MPCVEGDLCLVKATTPAGHDGTDARENVVGGSTACAEGWQKTTSCVASVVSAPPKLASAKR